MGGFFCHRYFISYTADGKDHISACTDYSLAFVLQTCDGVHVSGCLSNGVLQ